MTIHRTRRRAISILCLAALLSGCFTYVPTQIASVPVGEQVQVHLTPRAQVELSQRGRRVEETVRGTLAERRSGQLLLRVPIAAQQDGFRLSAIEQDLPVAEADVVGIDLRRFSGSRTALFVAGAAGGAALIVVTIIAAARRGGGPDGVDPEEIRIPILRVSAP
jgi:hypothetical protein